MKVALVHYWLLGMRGGEKVLEAMCRIFPDAHIFTLFYDPAAVSPFLRSKVVHTSWLNPARRFYRSLLPLMPMALEDLDLRGYDLVVSSESGPAKGVLTSANTRHLCYCHTPPRYLWELYPAYRHDYPGNPVGKALMTPFAHYLRMWDFSTAARVDGFMANSENVRNRIRKTYRRDSQVVHPPVAVETFEHRPATGYALIVSEMVAYKQLDYAIRFFARTGRPLKIVGGGPEYKTLRRLAAPNIEFCGRVGDDELRRLYSQADALIVPGEEDFGITMVEALASGKPVVALGRGGALEIVSPGCGVLFPEANETSLELAMTELEHMRNQIDPASLAACAAQFSEAAFERRFREVLSAG